MHISSVSRVLFLLLIIVSLFMVFPILFALYYGETGTINVEFDIDKACKQYNISDQQCGQWKELFGEMVAEMQGCATSLSNATLEKEISAQWTQQLSNIPRACSFPLY